MSFGFDKNNILYVATLDQLHAVDLSDTQRTNIESESIDPKNQGFWKGALKFDSKDKFRLKKLYDKEDSLEGNSVVGIFDREGVAAFDRIMVQGNGADRKLELWQVVKPLELVKEVEDKSRTTFRCFKHAILRDKSEVTVVVRLSGRADLYWNGKMISTTIGNDDYIYTKGLEINYEGIIMKRKRK